MQNFLLYFYTSLPFVAVALLSMLAIIGIGVGMVRPRYLAYVYLGVFFWANSTSYGSLSLLVSAGIYSRGSGLLFFPLLLWCMLGAWLCARVSASFRGEPAPACNLRPWFLAWTLLLGAHVAVAMFAGVPLARALAPSGFSNIVWIAPLVSLLLLSFRTPEAALALARFILLAGLGRALFGLVRWAAFGGDPNNVYANMNAIKIKLTFFDINDSLLCTLAFAIAAVNLFQAVRVRRAAIWTVLDWATLAAGAACIVLSYRRSAWIGFVLACIVVMLRFPPRRRLHIALMGLPLLALGVLAAAFRRLGQTKGAGGGLSSLFYDMESRRFGAESERVLELKLALGDFISHLFTGIGSWGRYTGYQHISWQTGQDAGLFLHSGVLHIALKAGLPGLVLLGCTIWAFCAFVRPVLRTLATLAPDMLGLATAGAAGLAFMLPDLLIGTPFPQTRTTQMLALCLALPYVAMAARRAGQTVRPAGLPAPAHTQALPHRASPAGVPVHTRSP
ncbi:O-antigen ligase family protein [Massilia phyllosphaerae]|uniref:O-antigen ligase family protein n=1 Tax=Massilia phyllosphaerae TaxID=3106034 RepID=UPI002B1CC24E|nr:O-antigen ligase family protein [Massilia sp. SGZ-792]